MALAELSERRESAPNLLMIKASTGLGAGIVMGGVLQRGSLGASGEIGHTKTAAARGMKCRCGDVGCVETVASGWALVHALRDQAEASVTCVMSSASPWTATAKPAGSSEAAAD